MSWCTSQILIFERLVFKFEEEATKVEVSLD